MSGWSVSTPAVLLLALSAVSLANNVCYLSHSGCKYRVTVLPTCSNQLSNDAPWQPGDPGYDDVTDETGTEPTPGGQGSELSIDPLKKLDSLESRLVKMMEELSVRSLRHIREIRSELRQMTASVNSLRGRSSRSGGLPASGEGSGPARCPAEFLGLGTWPACYRFSAFESTWHEAREFCAAFSANLVSLDSLKEAYIIDYLIRSHPEFGESKGWWTAGSYVVRSQRWMWAEQRQLKPMEFSRWAPGEPNARSTMHCMLLYKQAKYYWHDATCTDKHTFICELQL